MDAPQRKDHLLTKAATFLHSSDRLPISITREVNATDLITTRLEQRHGYRILYACESGSRAWGFASADSDYDVRFLFAWPKADYYLGVFSPRDAIGAQSLLNGYLTNEHQGLRETLDRMPDKREPDSSALDSVFRQLIG